MSESKLLLEKDGPLGWIIFNQPEKRNAVSQEMWQRMPDYIQEFKKVSKRSRRNAARSSRGASCRQKGGQHVQAGACGHGGKSMVGCRRELRNCVGSVHGR
jgi:hypothetical protein